MSSRAICRGNDRVTDIFSFQFTEPFFTFIRFILSTYINTITKKK